MEFTPRELKQIERLRKQEREWPRTRWIMLVVGLFDAALYPCIMVFVLHRLFHTENDPAPRGELFSSFNIFMFTFCWPVCLLALCHSFWMMTVAICDWHGNINRRLLLKLLEDRQNQTPGPGKII
jgi:succinate dehydrogenase hydrophobic anchor subunit